MNHALPRSRLWRTVPYSWSMPPTAFTTEGKALTTTELRSGDLAVSGYAAVWKGLDLQNENFLRGSFRNSISTFLAGNAALLYHHDGTKALGRVLELREDDVGLWFKARLDHQPTGSPLRWIFDAVKRGTVRGVSAAGKFSRTVAAGRRMISSVLLTEISLTPYAVHPETWATAVEVKAARSRAEALDVVVRRLEVLDLRLRVHALRR